MSAVGTDWQASQAKCVKTLAPARRGSCTESTSPLRMQIASRPRRAGRQVGDDENRRNQVTARKNLPWALLVGNPAPSVSP